MSQFFWKVAQAGVFAGLLYWAVEMTREPARDNSGAGLLLAFILWLVLFGVVGRFQDMRDRRRAGLPMIERAWLIRNGLWLCGAAIVALALYLYGREHSTFTPWTASVFALGLMILTRMVLAVITFKGEKVRAPISPGTDLSEKPDHDADRARIGWPEPQETPEVLEIPAREQARKLLRPPA